MLTVLDILLTLIHFAIIIFNLLGWILPATRKAHLICVAATAACWFVLGIWFGIGYCPVTDWEWQVKTKLGEHDLPASFITYYADKITGKNISSSLTDTITVATFSLAACLSLYVNFMKKKGRDHKS